MATANLPEVQQPPLGNVVYDKPISYYQRAIAAMPVAAGFDPRHIEGYMRLQHDTLSRLTNRQFNREVRLCIECIREGGLEAAESNAQSFGL
jgi:hypothetical protein